MNIMEPTMEKIDREALSSIVGFVFDMDGTLTVPLNKTAKIKAHLNIPNSVECPLAYIKAMPDEEEKAKAWAFVEELEAECLPKMKLKPQVTQLLLYLHTKKIKLALMTKNTAASVKHFISLLRQEEPSLPDPIFSWIIARDIPDTPLKPDSEIITFICDEERWSVLPNQILVVGDRKEDIECGHSKSAVTALVVNEGMIKSDFPFDKCNIVVSSISRLLEILEDCLNE